MAHILCPISQAAWDRFVEYLKPQIPKGVPVPLTFIVVGKRWRFFYFQAANGAYDATRHHLRFFQGAGEKYAPVQYFTFLSYSIFSIKDKTGNVFGGLVVDKDVTSPNISDFYLQSHPGLKGSECLKFTWHASDCLLSCCPTASRPSHYIVLHNRLGLTIDMWVIRCIRHFVLSSPTIKDSTNKLLPMLHVRAVHKICIHSCASLL